jgi:hypothetical protein
VLGNLLAIFGLIIVLVIFIEYRNEKKYQEERRKKREKRFDEKPIRNNRAPKKDIVRETTPRVQREEPEELQKEEQPKKQLPQCKYPIFSHVRLIDMGLSDEESKEFVAELIPQLETQIPLIKEAMENSNFHQMERLTHNIKGSATNLGTGGISDLLVECNTYLKTGTDSDIAKVYFDNLIHYTEELKTQYA